MLNLPNYSARDIAEITGKTVETVRMWIRAGKLKGRRPKGCRDYIVNKSDFDLFWYGNAVDESGD